MKHVLAGIALSFAFALVGCDKSPKSETNAFVKNLRAHCGSTFAGKVTSTDAQDDDFRNSPIVVEIQCSREAILMPLHVGDDHSRAWRLTRTDDGDGTLKLTHWHMHDDGSEDETSRYGGLVTQVATAGRQEFPADAETKRIFDELDISVSKQNTWAFDIDPNANLFAYEMSRPNRYFRIQFDMSNPVERPSEKWWGSETADFGNTF